MIQAYITTKPTKPNQNKLVEKVNSSPIKYNTIMDTNNTNQWEQLAQTQAIQSAPIGSFTTKSAVFRGVPVSLDYTQQGDNIFISMGSSELIKVLTDDDLEIEKRINKVFPDWSFPFYYGNRPAVFSGYLKLNNVDEENKSIFLAEGFINFGVMYRVLVYADSCDMKFIPEADAFESTLARLHEWRKPLHVLQQAEEAFGVNATHLVAKAS